MCIFTICSTFKCYIICCFIPIYQCHASQFAMASLRRSRTLCHSALCDRPRLNWRPWLQHVTRPRAMSHSLLLCIALHLISIYLYCLLHSIAVELQTQQTWWILGYDGCAAFIAGTWTFGIIWTSLASCLGREWVVGMTCQFDTVSGCFWHAFWRGGCKELL